MNRSERFKGIFTALVTPMLEDSSIDYVSLQSLVSHQLSSGTHGFYVGGSTAEAFLLTTDERMKILEVVVNESRGRAAVIAHIGCISTDESMRLAKHAEQVGVDAISAVVPFYYKTSLSEIQVHYESIMSSVNVPLIMYHYPSATGVNVPVDFYEGISKNPQCIGIKFTSQNLFEMQQIRERCGEDFLIYNGHDEVYAAGVIMGADGAIGSTMNMMPGLYISMFKASLSNRFELLYNYQKEANNIISHMLKYDVIPYEKFILYLQGIIKTSKTRQPLKQLSEAEKEEIIHFFNTNDTLFD